jgi:three-Cys-motif partner protein
MSSPGLRSGSPHRAGCGEMAKHHPTVWKIDPHTQAKHRILRGYLDSWLPILGSWSSRLGYIDGFAGPGRYAGGEDGSPIIALKAALEHRASLRSELVCLFIEQDGARKAQLEQELAQLPLPSNIKVHLEHGRFDETMDRVLDELAGDRLAPIFAFVDPFGWSQTPFTLIARLLAIPHSEVLVNFMYEEVNRFLGVPAHASKWDRLFGIPDWREIVPIKAPTERRQRIHDLYKAQLQRAGAEWVWSFEMRNRSRTTDYFLFFGTKNITGLEKMKEAMWRVDHSGGFIFADPKHSGQPLELEFEPNYAFLRRLIQERFAGQQVPVEEVGRFVLIETPFLASHYKRAVLAPMERESPPALQVINARPNRRRGTFPSRTVVAFAPSSGPASTSSSQREPLRVPTSAAARGARLRPRLSEVSDDDVLLKERWKSGGTLGLRSMPGWQAHIRDQGHGRGFIITVCRQGQPDPIYITRTAAGVRWGVARIQAAQFLLRNAMGEVQVHANVPTRRVRSRRARC